MTNDDGVTSESVLVNVRVPSGSKALEKPEY